MPVFGTVIAALFDSANFGALILSILFALCGLAFLNAYLRSGVCSATTPEKLLCLSFDERAQVQLDGDGGKIVRVLLRNTSKTRTLKDIVVKLKTLETLTKKRFADPCARPLTDVPLQPEQQTAASADGFSLGPGSSATYCVAKSIMGDGFLYVPAYLTGENAQSMLKIALAPYLATITASAQDLPEADIQIELPVAGRGIGRPRPAVTKTNSVKMPVLPARTF